MLLIFTIKKECKLDMLLLKRIGNICKNFIEKLKNYDGNNIDVRNYVLQNKESMEFLEKMSDLMNLLIPLYEKEGKVRLNIAMGCTGGKHRSVVIANKISSFFSSMKYIVNLNHRDIHKN